MMLITRPRKVSTLGEIRVSARPFTIFCSKYPLPFPNALVQVIEWLSLSCDHRITVIAHAVDLLVLLTGRNIRVRNFFVHLIVEGDQLEHFELAVAVGRDHGRGFADLLGQQGAADGRGRRDQALGDVGLLAGDEFVADLLVLAGLENHHARAEAALVVGNVDQVDQRQLAHSLLQLAEAGVHEDLALLGHVVLGVLAQVSERDCLLDLRRQLGCEFTFQQPDFFFEPLLNMVWHGAFRNLLEQSSGCRAGSRHLRTGFLMVENQAEFLCATDVVKRRYARTPGASPTARTASDVDYTSRPTQFARSGAITPWTGAGEFNLSSRKSAKLNRRVVEIDAILDRKSVV